MEGSADIKEETLGGKDFIISREDYSSTCSFMDIYSGHEFYCCTVQAKTDCVGYRLTIDDCWRLLHSDSLFHEYLIVRWANIFYKSTNNSYRYTIYTFREKLFTFLLENGEKTHQNSYIIHISREELANLIGCSKRTLYRILNEMKVKNLISIVETRIVYTAEQKIKLEKEIEKLQ